MPGVFRLPSASTRCVSKGLSRSRTDNFVVVRAGHQRGDASLWQLYRNRLLPAPTARLGCSDAATAKIAEPEHQLSPTREASKRKLGAKPAPWPLSRPNAARGERRDEAEMCSECGNFTLVRNGTCMKCNTCGVVCTENLNAGVVVMKSVQRRA